MRGLRFATVLGAAACLGVMMTGSHARAAGPEGRKGQEEAARHQNDRDDRGERKRRQLVITSAFADLDAELLTIRGRNLSTWRPPRVRLEGVELQVIKPFSADEILAVLPPDTVPGSYLLTVWRGPGAKEHDAFDLAIGVGLKGPVGPQGPPGAVGPVGPAGLSCWDLNANRICETASEDQNGDSVCTAADCAGPPGPPGGGLAGQSCGSGNVVVGFDAEGNIVCAPTGSETDGSVILTEACVGGAMGQICGTPSLTGLAEMRNNSAFIVDLTGWELVTQVPSQIELNLRPLGGLLNPGEYRALLLPDASSGSSVSAALFANNGIGLGNAPDPSLMRSFVQWASPQETPPESTLATLASAAGLWDDVTDFVPLGDGDGLGDISLNEATDGSHSSAWCSFDTSMNTIHGSTIGDAVGGANVNCPPGPPTCSDSDGDGFSVGGGSCGPVDCHDDDPSIYPGAEEVCGDLLDNDCNGTVDESCVGVVDPSFEQGAGGGVWGEFSENFGTPLCDDNSCGGTGGGSGPRTGSWWVWLGGNQTFDEIAWVSQSVNLPPGAAATLVFHIEIPSCDTDTVITDDFIITLDGTPMFSTDNRDATCGTLGYVRHEVDISTFLGSTFLLEIRADVSSPMPGGGVTNFFVDDVSIVHIP